MLQFGINLKTPMWFEPFRFFSETEAGLPRTDKINATLPLIVTTGFAIKPTEKTLLALDFRYLNYASTESFGDPAQYEPNGRVSGLGWNDVYSVALGIQREITDSFTVRAGYSHNTSLIDDRDTFINIDSNLDYQHLSSFGFSYELREGVVFNMTYSYLPAWRSSGPYVLPGVGEVPGSNVITTADTHVATMGINVAYWRCPWI